MIKIEHIEVYGWDAAIRGMRNPMNSWEKSDTNFNAPASSSGILLGANDLNLMHRLYKAGTEHRKYLRMITVTMDIVAPLYWWKEADQYKVGTVTDSCSTMHKIAAKEFEFEDFSYEHLGYYKDFMDAGIDCPLTPNVRDDSHLISPKRVFSFTINMLNRCRELYLATGNKTYWWQMIQLLPSSYNQRRTILMNYENVFSMIRQRSGHKLDEWREFVKELESLPYIKEIEQDGNSKVL